MIVIIGGGPIGLYFLNKMIKVGIKTEDVVLFDPHAGEYIRPGQFGEYIFRRVESGLETSLWPAIPKRESGHIKELERLLWLLATDAGARIEKKEFIRLHQDASTPGVIIAEKGGAEEFIAADMVFDCSGYQKVVIRDLNQRCPESPLKSTTFMDVPVPNHFIAQVRINEDQFKLLNEKIRSYKSSPQKMDPIAFSRAMVQLRELSWTHLSLPRVVTARCGKDGGNKAVLYLQAPNALEKVNYDKWVQAVLNCYGGFHYDRLSLTRKHHPKKDELRFTSFSMNAEILQEVVYKGEDLPVVMGLGDTQVSFNYMLGHGVQDGVIGVDLLFNHTKIKDGKIIHVDWNNFRIALHQHLESHKQAMINEAQREIYFFEEALEIAKVHFAQAILVSTEEHEREMFQSIILEIDARQSHARAIKAFSESADSAGEFKIVPLMSDLLVSKLNFIQQQLLIALSGLPDNLEKERQGCSNMLVDLADRWQLMGNFLLKEGKLSESENAYQKALAIFNLPCFREKYSLKEVIIYSQLTKNCIERKKYSQALEYAVEALKLHNEISPAERNLELYEEIVFNIIWVSCEQAHREIVQKNYEDATILHRKTKNFLVVRQDAFVNPIKASQAAALVDDLEKKCNLLLESYREMLVVKVGVSDNALLEYGFFKPAEKTTHNVAKSLQSSCTIL